MPGDCRGGGGMGGFGIDWYIMVLQETHGNSVFSSPHSLNFNSLVIFSLKNVKQGHKLELTYLYMFAESCTWVMHMKHCYQKSKWNA